MIQYQEKLIGILELKLPKVIAFLNINPSLRMRKQQLLREAIKRRDRYANKVSPKLRTIARLIVYSNYVSSCKAPCTGYH